MLNINEVESTNVVEIAGILKELDVEEKTTNDGRDYVSAKAVIKVDQEINGQAVACEIPVRQQVHLFQIELPFFLVKKVVLKFDSIL